MNNFDYNLTTESWIPYVNKQGEVSSGGLIDVLKKAHNIRSLSFENPMHELSVLLILIALTHRVTDKEHTEVYKDGRFSETLIDTYFEKWKSRFNLFDKTYPFMQLAGLQNTKINRIAVVKEDKGDKETKFIYESFKPFFNHNFYKNTIALPPEEAVIQLLQNIYFKKGGTFKKESNIYGKQGSAFNTEFVSGCVLLNMGGTLFETLVFNLYSTYESSFIEKFTIGKPSWEHDDQKYSDMVIDTTCKNDSVSSRVINGAKYLQKYGYLGYLTAKSRVIWLVPEKIDNKLYVKSYHIAQGVKFEEGFENIFMYYKKDKNKFVPLKFDENRLFWRDSSAFLSITKEDKPLVSMLTQREFKITAKEAFMHFGVFGLYSNLDKPIRTCKEVLTVPRTILECDILKFRLNEAVTFAEDVSKCLVLAELLLLKPEPAEDEKEKKKTPKKDDKKIPPTAGIQYSYWSRLDMLFHEFLKQIEDENSLQNWKDNVKDVATQSLEEGSSGFGYKAIAKARNEFEKSFYQKEKK